MKIDPFSMRFVQALVLIGAGLLHAPSNAQSSTGYPTRPITLVAPYAAGGDSDASARNLAAVATKYLGQPVIVQNVVGASGVIGTMRVRTSAADGYTLLIARGASAAIVPALDTKAPYKWNEFSMLSVLDINPVACAVRSDSPYATIKDLLADLKARPGKLNYATAGPGTTQHMAVEVLLSAAGLPSNSAEAIGYKSGGETTAALLGGQVQFICNNLQTLGGQFKGGTMRGLLTSTPERLKDHPDIPTARELNLGAMEQVVGWSALFGPPGLPTEVSAKWADALKRISQDPDWLKGNAAFGALPAIRSAAETEKFTKTQYDLYEKLGATLGLRK